MMTTSECEIAKRDREIETLKRVLSDLTLRFVRGTASKIDAIRARRACTNDTLKDSKDWVERFWEQNDTKPVHQPFDHDARIQRLEDRVALLERAKAEGRTP